MSKSEVKTRKSQLIHTFGPGAMQVNKKGVSMLACGLDYWFSESGTQSYVDSKAIQKYIVQDERLAKKLGVREFRTPPDATIKFQDRKISMPLPAQRFPYWHICSNTNCQAMQKESPIKDDQSKCSKCGSIMYQSRFITICSHGHLQDFPWVEWINKNSGANCSDKCQLKLIGTGSTTSAGIKVKCITHDTKPVSLAGVFHTEKEGSEVISSTLKKKEIHCSGAKPWLGSDSFSTCEKPLVAALRQATNVYFAKSDSSILLPVSDIDSVNRVYSKYENIPKEQKQVIEGAGDIHTKAQMLSLYLGPEFEVSELINFFNNYEQDEENVTELSEVDYRYQEYKHFLESNKDGCLITKVRDIDNYKEWMSNFFSKVTQVKQITVTNAFYGFDRIQPSKDRKVKSYKSDLWEKLSSTSSWLPAVKVYGEGIFIEFRAEVVKNWSAKFTNEVGFKRVRDKSLSSSLHDKIGILSPAYLLIHTFSHLLINQVIFDCGYSTASLRERIYVSEDAETEMYGVLIYTAAGDSEGSLGGLVRMAEPNRFENVIKKAIESANWCSSDPICREQGDKGGQGPYGMNLAACHNCALLPETSCENFNTLLDRGCITSKDLSNKGFFDVLYSTIET